MTQRFQVLNIQAIVLSRVVSLINFYILCLAFYDCCTYHSRTHKYNLHIIYIGIQKLRLHGFVYKKKTLNIYPPLRLIIIRYYIRRFTAPLKLVNKILVLTRFLFRYTNRPSTLNENLIVNCKEMRNMKSNVQNIPMIAATAREQRVPSCWLTLTQN